MGTDTFVNQFQRGGTDLAGLAPAETALVFDGTAFSLVDVPDAVITGADGSTITGYTLVKLGGTPPTVTTTDASGAVLATIPIPPGSTVHIECVIIANLGAGNVNANLGPTIYRLTADAARTGSGAPASPSPTLGGGVSKPFTSFGASGNTGCATYTIAGNNLVIYGFGFPAPSPWANTTAYVAGNGTTVAADFVTANGNVYVCTTSGTSSGSAPSGTGTGLGTGALFAFVCTGSLVQVRWTIAFCFPPVTG